MTNLQKVAKRSDAICVLHAEVERLQEAIQKLLYNQERDPGCQCCNNNHALFIDLDRALKEEA